MASSPISFGGLASGLDTSSIIDKLVELQSQPITNLQKQETGVKAQISTLGDLTSKLAALQTAARDLGTNGVLGVRSTGTATSFTATPGTGAFPGAFSVQVKALAQAAKAQSSGLPEGGLVGGGSIDFTVQGKPYTVAIDDGSTLDQIASALRASGAPISATVLDTGSQRYLSITSLATGYPPDQTADAALSLKYTADPKLAAPNGSALSFNSIQTASNASFTVDGLPFTRTTNTISDAIPGTTITLKQPADAAENLVLESDPDATKARLQKFVDAYNGVLKLVQQQLAVTKDTDRAATLAGDASVRSLQTRLQQLVSTMVPGTGSVRSLADLGVKTSYTDGSLSIDAATLGAAIGRDPSAVDALFSTAGSGLSSIASALVDQFTRPGDGLLVSRQASLADTVKQMDADVARKQAQVDSYRDMLVAQFTAMESAVSKIKASGTFLTQQLDANSK